MQRILRRRSDDPATDEEASASAGTPAAGPDPESQTTTPSSDPGFRERGRLRRRLRFLRRARELGYRDLGGLVFDLRRFDRQRPDLVDEKVQALTVLDQELRSIEIALDDRRPIHLLREPGVSQCATCGGLHASHDNFCPTCGTALGAVPPDASEPAHDEAETQTFKTPAGD